MRKISRLLAASFVLMAAFLLNCQFQVRAAEGNANSLLYVAGYEVTNETITPGSSFVLTLKLKNYSPTEVAENIIVALSNPDGVVPEYGTVTTQYYSKMNPLEEKTLEFKYTANSDITKTDLNFAVAVSTDSGTTGVQLRIPVGRMTDFSIKESLIPQKLNVGMIGYASAQIENLGNRSLNNVYMVARCDGEDIGSASIGTIAARTFKNQYVSMSFDSTGHKAVDLVLTYKNADGEEKEFIITSQIIEVTEKGQTDNSLSPDSTQDLTNDGTGNMQGVSIANVLVLSLSGVLLIIVCCVILLLMYRRK